MRRKCFIVGPTASGKSAVAAELAHLLGSSVINADAYQVYQGLETISAAPEESELARAPHELFSFVPAQQEWDAHQHRQAALPLLSSADAPPAVITGGSGLYIKFLSHGPSDLPQSDPQIRRELDQLDLTDLVERLRQLDPIAAETTDPHNRRYLTRNIEISLLSGRPVSELNDKSWKPELQAGTLGFYLEWERDELVKRIEQRTHQMLSAGAIEEVAALQSPSATCAKAIGVTQIQAYLKGEISREKCAELITIATRQYAKRQRTWFRRESQWLSAIPISSDSSPATIAQKIADSL